MKKFLNKKRKGMGGIFFITVALIGAYIALVTIHIAKASTVVSISDNIAHVVATKITINNYRAQTADYDSGIVGEGYCVKRQNGTCYYPLQEYNTLLEQLGYLDQKPTKMQIKWGKNKRLTVLKIGSFTIRNQPIAGLDNRIYPHDQEVIIEDK